MFDYDKFDYPNTYENCSLIEDRDKNGNIKYWNNLELVKDIFTFQCSVGCRWGDLHSMKVGMFTIQTDYFVWMMEKTKTFVKVPRNPISDVGIKRDMPSNIPRPARRIGTTTGG